MLSTNGKWRFPATLIRVIDGDTVVLELDLGMEIFRKGSYRLYGINAPEHDAASTQVVTDMLMGGGAIEVETYKADKYGRYLVDLFVMKDGAWVSVNQTLLDMNLAVPYFGGKR